MKTRIFGSSLLIVLVTLVFTACRGPMGPEGVQGPTGYDGNSAVISSVWYTPTAWSYDNKTKEYYFDVTSSEITQDIVENGVILAYASFANDWPANSVRPLPAYALGCNWDVLVPDYGTIEFVSDAVIQPGTTGYSFRFVLIPASVYLKSAKLKSTNISDFKNKLQNMTYPEVCKFLGIQE